MRKIALITTSRADYGIQSRLIRLLQESPDVDFSLIVSGSHLSEKHGLTIHEIEKDGIEVTHKVRLGIDEGESISMIMSEALVGFSAVLKEIAPDICVVLGDRYEMMAAATACVLNNIVVAHIHGGETTQGAIDEIFRHSITKAAHLHFTSCETYRNRVVQLGESPNRVFNVGSLGVENIHHIRRLKREDLEEDLGIAFRDVNFLVTFHPVTMEKGSAGRQTDELLEALSCYDDVLIIFTHPNADAGSDEVADRISAFVDTHPNSRLFSSLGVKRYFSVIEHSNVVIGNSSSGILEVPSIKKPTVNIGDRQSGRVRATSVIDCDPERNSIKYAIDKALSQEVKGNLASVVNPYDKPGTAEAIFTKLKESDISGVMKKNFYDIIL